MQTLSEEGVTLITVTAEKDGDFFFVSSPDLPGLALKGRNYQELFEKTPHLVKELYKDNYGQNVSVSEPYALDEKYLMAIKEAA